MVGVPSLAAWMIGAHVAHGLAVAAAARHLGRRPQRRRAVRFGLYACGWDLMASPVGAAIVLLSAGTPSVRALGSLSMRLPSMAAWTFLRGVYGFCPDDANRARRMATGAIVLIIPLTAAVAAALVMLAAS